MAAFLRLAPSTDTLPDALALLRKVGDRPQDRSAAATAQEIAAEMLGPAWGLTGQDYVEVCRIGYRAFLVDGAADLDLAAEWAIEEAFALDESGDRAAGWNRLIDVVRDDALGATPGRIRACAVAAEWASGSMRVGAAAESAATARALYGARPQDLDEPSRAYAEVYWLDAEILAHLAAARPDLAAPYRDRVLAAARLAEGQDLLDRAHLRRISVLAGLERFGAAARAADEALGEVSEYGRPAVLSARAVAVSRLAESEPARLQEAIGGFEVVLQIQRDLVSDRFRLGNLVRLVDCMSRAGADWEARAVERLDEAERLLLQLGAGREDALLEEQIYTAALRWRLSPEAERGPLRERLRAVHSKTLSVWSRLDPTRTAAVRQFDYSNLVLEALLESCEARDGGAREALAVLAESSAVGSLARRWGLAAPTADQVRALVPEGGGVLIYVIGWHRLFVLAVDVDGLELAGSPEDQAALDRRRAWTAALRRGAGDPDAGPGVLAQLLPDRIRQRVAGWSAVRVVGLDEHGHVPFEWLPGDGGVLGDRLAVSYLPSLTVGAHLANRTRMGEGRGWITVLGDDLSAAGVGSRWPHLDPIEPSADVLALWRDAGRVDRGDRARTEAMFAGDAARLTVMAHGVYDVAESRSGLVLADGVAWADEMGASDAALCPSSVVLLACGAGRQVPLRGDDGAHGLAGAFVMAGASEIVLSSERLRQDFALAVDASLRRHVLAGASLTDALQRARRELAAEWSDRQPVFGLLRVVGVPPR